MSQLDGAERRIQIERLRRVNRVERRKPKAGYVITTGKRKKRLDSLRLFPTHYQLAAEAVVAQVKRLAISTSCGRARW
jgi:hypothetical protein